MIKATDTAALLAFMDTQEEVFTVSACGVTKTFSEPNESRVVGNAMSRALERSRLFTIRRIELARDILHARGELET